MIGMEDSRTSDTLELRELGGCTLCPPTGAISPKNQSNNKSVRKVTFVFWGICQQRLMESSNTNTLACHGFSKVRRILYIAFWVTLACYMFVCKFSKAKTRAWPVLPYTITYILYLKLYSNHVSSSRGT